MAAGVELHRLYCEHSDDGHGNCQLYWHLALNADKKPLAPYLDTKDGVHLPDEPQSDCLVTEGPTNTSIFSIFRLLHDQLKL